ncbi:MAG: hypothetical protein E7K14_05305 [Bacillota bacterium]|nr:hypothetical protein [Bacillota bacterium]
MGAGYGGVRSVYPDPVGIRSMPDVVAGPSPGQVCIRAAGAQGLRPGDRGRGWRNIRHGRRTGKKGCGKEHACGADIHGVMFMASGGALSSSGAHVPCSGLKY